jgi:hypothetical protein
MYAFFQVDVDLMKHAAVFATAYDSTRRAMQMHARGRDLGRKRQGRFSPIISNTSPALPCRTAFTEYRAMP